MEDYVKIESEYYQKEQENIEYYKTTIAMINEEINSLDDDKDKIECIERYLKELKKELWRL